MNGFLRWATVVEEILEGCDLLVKGCYVEFLLQLFEEVVGKRVIWSIEIVINIVVCIS